MDSLDNTTNANVDGQSESVNSAATPDPDFLESQSETPAGGLGDDSADETGTENKSADDSDAKDDGDRLGNVADESNTNDGEDKANDDKKPESEPINLALPADAEDGQYDQARFERYKPLFEESGMTQEVFNKFLQEMDKEAAEKIQEAEREKANILVKWDKELADDPVYGGKDLQERLKSATNNVYKNDNLVAPELREFMKESGLNRWPPVVKLFLALDKVTKDHDGIFNTPGQAEESRYDEHNRPKMKFNWGDGTNNE